MKCNWCSLKYCRMDCPHNKQMALLLKRIVERERNMEVKHKEVPVETGNFRPSIRRQWRYEDDT